MSTTRATVGLVAFLGALSLAAGFAAGRFRRAPGDVPVSAVTGEESAVVENETTVVPEESTAFPAPTRTEAPPREPVPPAEDVDGALPRAELEDVAEIIESFKDATPEEIARLKWDRRVRAVLDRLRASAPGVYPVDSGLPPAVLAELTAALLERARLSLSEEQRAELAALAAERQSDIDRRLADLGDDALALERELCVVHAIDEFLEAASGLLDERQLRHLDSSAPEMLEWPPILSPLTGAPVTWRELETHELPALRESLSRELAREFGLDPHVADGYAARFVTDFGRLLRSPPRRGDIVERIVAFGEAQARVFREILAHPALDEAARRRIRAGRSWVAPVLAR